jgi:iron complex transport system ATP-binding protein
VTRTDLTGGSTRTDRPPTGPGSGGASARAGGASARTGAASAHAGGASARGAGASGLDASRLDFTRGGRLVVDGVDITAPPGSVSALLGPNGAGKSTLLHLIAGLERADAGTVALGGRDVGTLRRRDRARRIAIAEQEVRDAPNLTVREVVALGRTPHLGLWGVPGDADRGVVERCLAETGLTGFAERGYDTLSGGERQRANLARALAQEPDLLLLDEPTNHLDLRAQLGTLTLLRRLVSGRDAVEPTTREAGADAAGQPFHEPDEFPVGGEAGGEASGQTPTIRAGAGPARRPTVLAALHDLNLAAAFADHVVVLAEGRVVASGSPRSVLTPERIAAVWGVEAQVLEHPVTGRAVIAFTSLTDGSPGDPADGSSEGAADGSSKGAPDGSSKGAADGLSENPSVPGL